MNLAGFRASEDPRFEAGIPDFMNGILNFSIHFNVVHRKVDWRNPKMKSLNSMPVVCFIRRARIAQLVTAATSVPRVDCSIQGGDQAKVGPSAITMDIGLLTPQCGPPHVKGCECAGFCSLCTKTVLGFFI